MARTKTRPKPKVWGGSLDLTKCSDQRLLLASLSWNGLTPEVLQRIPEILLEVARTAADPRARVGAAKVLVAIVQQQINLVKATTEEALPDLPDNPEASLLEKIWGEK